MLEPSHLLLFVSLQIPDGAAVLRSRYESSIPVFHVNDVTAETTIYFIAVCSVKLQQWSCATCSKRSGTTVGACNSRPLRLRDSRTPQANACLIRQVDNGWRGSSTGHPVIAHIISRLVEVAA